MCLNYIRGRSLPLRGCVSERTQSRYWSHCTGKIVNITQFLVVSMGELLLLVFEPNVFKTINYWRYFSSVLFFIVFKYFD